MFINVNVIPERCNIQYINSALVTMENSEYSEVEAIGLVTASSGLYCSQEQV